MPPKLTLARPTGLISLTLATTTTSDWLTSSDMCSGGSAVPRQGRPDHKKPTAITIVKYLPNLILVLLSCFRPPSIAVAWVESPRFRGFHDRSNTLNCHSALKLLVRVRNHCPP